MGFFNAISTINKINRLLKDLENQVTISQDQVRRNAPVATLQNSLNVLKRLHQELIDEFCKSSTARLSAYNIFGDKMNMHKVLTYSKNVIYNLAAIIHNRQM